MKQRYISLILLCSTCLTVSACETVRIDVKPKDDPLILKQVINSKEAYSLGKGYLAVSYYGLALEAFRKDLQINGPNVPGLNGLAVTYDMLGRYDLSQKYYEQALIIDPFSPITYGNLAYSQYKQGEYENAQRLLEKARSLATGDPEVNKVLDSYEDKIQRDRIKNLEKKMIGIKASYQPVRISERRWSLMKKIPDVTKPAKQVKYKAHLSMDKILFPQKTQEITLSEPESVLKTEKIIWSKIKGEKITWLNHPTYSVLNGTGRGGMAKRVSNYIERNGEDAPRLGNARRYNYSTSFIEYIPGYETVAEKLSKMFDIPVKMKAVGELKANVQLTLGADLLSFDESLIKSKDT